MRLILHCTEKKLRKRETKPTREKEGGYEEVITELKTKVTYLETNAEKNESKAHDFEADYQQAKVTVKVM